MNTPEQSALQTIRQRLIFILTGDGAPPSAREILAPAVEELDMMVDGHMERQVWDPANPDHGNSFGKPITPAQFWFGTNYLATTLRMAIAWRCPFSKHHQNGQVMERLIGSLRFADKFVRPDQPRDGAWHSWDIDFPFNLARILLICGDALPADLRERVLEDLARMPSKVFDLDRERGITRPPLTSGANNVSILYVAVLRGLVTDDPQWLATASVQLPVAMNPNSGGEGLQSDWSYHFHGPGVNAAYGLSCLSLQAHWIYLMQGTPWEVPAELRNLHVSMIREFFARNVWRGRISLYTIDRNIFSESFYAHLTFLSVLYGVQSGLPDADQAMFNAAAADFLRSVDVDGQPTPRSEMRLSMISTEMVMGLLLSQLQLPANANAHLLDGMRYYPESEYLLVREPNWFAAVRMSSAWTSTWKSMLGCHTQGSSSAEFSILLMVDGREVDKTTITTMNWKRLMGVTRCDAIEPAPEGNGQSTFCSALAGDEFTVMGLQYLLAPSGQDVLRGNKSLFATPQALVLLGSQIKCDSLKPVVTTLFHAPLITDGPFLRNGATLNVGEDGVWELTAGETVFLRNVGIHLLTDAQLIIETRKGCIADLNMPQIVPVDPSDRAKVLKVYEQRWVYVVVNHGIRPTNGRYAAIICPGSQPIVDAFHIKHDDDHHVVSIQNGALGGEVRFPGDWRRKIGSSYWGAEQHQWGSIARWLPADDADHAQLEIIAPRRFPKLAESNTEIFLPNGLEMENVTLKTYAGTPFPANILSLSANGKVLHHRVRRTGKADGTQSRAIHKF